MKAYKTFAAEFKVEGDDGTFQGHLSAYGNVDSQNEVVSRGAMKRSIERWKQKGSPVPLPWMHGREGMMPIGSMDPGEMKDDDIGLFVKGKLLLDIERAREVYACLKAGVATGMSIGFKTLKDSWKNGVRYLDEIRLYEGSIVLAGANELALVSGVKAEDGVEVQSLIFPKEHWEDSDAAKRWAKSHGFSSDAVDETRSSFRMRQQPPGKFARMRTICINPNGAALDGKCKVKAVVGVPKKGSIEDSEYRGALLDINGAMERKDIEAAISTLTGVAELLRDAVDTALSAHGTENITEAVDEIQRLIAAVMSSLWAFGDMESGKMSAPTAEEIKQFIANGLSARRKATPTQPRVAATSPPAAIEVPPSFKEAVAGLVNYTRRLT